MAPFWVAAGFVFMGTAAAAANGDTQRPERLRARSYERWVQPRHLAADAQLVARAVRHWGRTYGLQLVYDWRLHQASAASLAWAAVHAGADLPLAAVQQALWQAGCTDAGLSVVALRAPAAEMALRVQKALAQKLPHTQVNRFGVARCGDTVVIALSMHRMHLIPTPAIVHQRQSLRLAGQDLDSCIKALSVVLARPDGSLEHLPQTLLSRAFAQLVNVGETPGILDIQIVVDCGRGPEVAAQYPVGIGQAPWPLQKEVLATGAVAPMPQKSLPGNARAAHQIVVPPAAADLITLVWGLRRAHGLSLPIANVRLMRAAQQHADAMHHQHFFAHLSPHHGDVTKRLALLHQPYVRVVENIAASGSLDEAFAQWVRSPSHRSNLLDPSVTAIGAGIALREPPADILAVLVMAHIL